MRGYQTIAGAGLIVALLMVGAAPAAGGAVSVARAEAVAGAPAAPLLTASGPGDPAGWWLEMPGWPASAGPLRLQSYRELRYDGVVAQTDWSTCGPAVLATYLTYYVGRRTSEAEMIRLTMESGLAGQGLAAPGTFGATMLQLRDALARVGVEAAGYRVSVAGLLAYFDRGGPPLVLHLTRPAAHYVLAVGLVENDDRRWLLVADPSFGRRLVGPEELEPSFGFSGNVLVPIPPEPLLTRVATRQREELAREASRLTRLWAAASSEPAAVVQRAHLASNRLTTGSTHGPMHGLGPSRGDEPAAADDRASERPASPLDPVRLPDDERGDLLVSLGLELSPFGREGAVIAGDAVIPYAEVTIPATARLALRYTLARGLSLSLAAEGGWTHHRTAWFGGDRSQHLQGRRVEIAGAGLHYQTRRSAAGLAAGFDVRWASETAHLETSLSRVRDPLVVFGSLFYQADRASVRRRTVGMGVGAAFVANERITLRASMALSVPLSGLELPASAASWRLAYRLDPEGEQEVAVYGSWGRPGASGRIGVEWTARLAK